MYATADIHSAGANAPCVGDRRIGVADADIPDVDQLPDRRFLHRLVEQRIEIL